MNFKSKLFVLGLVSKIFAADFAVVSFDSECQLSAGGQTYPMTKDESGVPLYRVTANVAENTKYNYICGGKPDVERTLTGNKTYNELVGRALTMYDMPEFGYPNAEPWDRTIGRTELFDPKYVPIVIVDVDKQFFVSGGGDDFRKITFVLQDKVFSFNNIPTSSKNGDEDKFQFRITLPGDGIYHRNVLKFRPSSYDPVFFRQILYGDIAHAIGNPTHESVSVRVYLSDGTPIGLYVLQEDCTSESFIRSAFYGDSSGNVKEFVKTPIYDCSTGADLNPNDPNQLGGFQSDVQDDMKFELLELANRLAALNVNDLNAVKDFDENWLDLDTLFRALALEYLAGDWDGYWFLTTNFVMYHPDEEKEGTQWNYSKFKYYFIEQDVDQTWSVGMKESLDPQNFPLKTYDQLINLDWKTINADQGGIDSETRLILTKLLGCDGQPSCYTKEYFENHLQSIVQHIFNPVAMKRKTDGYKQRLFEEMKWDLDTPRLHKGTKQQYQFTWTDFEQGIDTGNYLGSKFFYGILDWTTAICDTVCKQFNIEYDKVPYDPESAAKAKVDKIDAGTKLDTTSNLKTSDSIMNKTNVIFALVAVILSAVIYIY
ncbi:hypothetical protein BCR32DRAFT_298698 [Anaeromyces robustus]|jgi:hypothetical protein|uniref:Coth-domain-containing protein n=1 Tax=Anaeromyces robustus TaxID=1754192 RepID=A0A1Y1UYJ6_9FUNG|nr:hypothetical protein BCR32DRAFT_298698 [Anaeromyces robustus]|eukprot:ORX42687.1 hypothetical protein BCR32DRAFT_298698 [Anaeromyces robustus]